MEFVGEHLLPGKIGHFFVIVGFVASLLATIFFYTASKLNDIQEKKNWLLFARGAFTVQLFSVIIVFSAIFYICFHHYYEYMYAYKHTSKELEPKYLLACIWEGQEGSFLLWTIWQSILGIVIMCRAKEWEAPVMTVISFAQFFLLMMILGIYFFDVRIGNSPFTLTRNEINGPIFSRSDYLSFITDGVGLNVLLRNYWMVIHPPVLFLGFASTIIPFAYAYAGLQTKYYGDWVKPAIPYTLFSACILGIGIMMGGKWAYESLSFGGYWAWDPVENASLVPWMILISGLHTMVIYKATGHSLKISYLFAILAFGFVLYSTFLTRTGILGDTSVHAFTEAGKAINIMILMFVLIFVLPVLFLFFIRLKKIPGKASEEKTNSREFWMFIGSLVFFLSALFIIAKTSLPVFNKLFGTQWAQPENLEFSYNKVMILIAILIGLITAVAQFFKYKNTPGKYFVKKIAIPTILSLLITIALHYLYPMNYRKQGIGFLIAIDVALFAAIYATIANMVYVWSGLKGNLKAAGASFSHIGFGVMIAGILISSSNKAIISDSKVNGIQLPTSSIDPLTKMQDDPLENLTLIRQMPTRMGAYEVTFVKDSSGSEKGRKFYQLLFEQKNPSTGKITERFTLLPDVYQMKDNNLSSNPDTKVYFSKDIFTYISYTANNESKEDTAQFSENEMAIGDTVFYSKGYIILNEVIRNPQNEKYQFLSNDKALMADLSIVSKEGMHYKAKPAISLDGEMANRFDDTVYAQNMYIRFLGVSDLKKIKIGIKESDRIIDFITVKAYVFPYINFVWIGLIIMAVGFLMSLGSRLQLSSAKIILAIFATATALIYMFLLAH